MAVVPFSVSAGVEDLQLGVLEYLGTIAYEDGHLEMRYHEQTHGLKKANARRHRIALDQLDGVDFKRGWFGGCTMTLRAGRIDAFEGVPFGRGARLPLSVARKHRQDAINFMATVQTRLDFPASAGE